MVCQRPATLPPACRSDVPPRTQRLFDPIRQHRRDAATKSPEELEKRGIRRLPTSLRESTDALAADAVLRDALGSALIDSVVAVRESEIEKFAAASAEEVVGALRWTH